MRRPTLLTLCLALPLGACATAAPTPAPAPAPGPAAAPLAGPPATDIYLLTLRESAEALDLGAPRNLTDRAGYDNQPAFTPDGGAILYTSIRGDGQADVYRLDLATGTAARLTATPESEYSPTPLPGGGFSVVRVEADSTQRLWRFEADGANPRLVLEEVRPVGYHAWVDERTVALFVLGSPPTLRLADVGTGAAEVMAEDIGRSLHGLPSRRAVSFVHKQADGEWWIRVLDLDTREVDSLARLPAEVEDYAWTPSGTLLAGRGSSLLRWDAAASAWRQVADLGAGGVQGITRLAVSPSGDRLAVVGTRAQ